MQIFCWIRSRSARNRCKCWWVGWDLNPASSDGSRHRIQPGNGTLYWTSAETRYFLEISVHAKPGEPGKYALLIPPPGEGAQGKTRIYKLFLSGGYYAFVNPDE